MITQGSNVTITHQIVINGQVAFEANETVAVEAVSPDPQRPEYKYTVFSPKLNQRFSLSDVDVREATPVPIAPPPVATPPVLIPTPTKKTIGDRWRGLSPRGKAVVVGIVVLLLIIGIVGAVTESGKKETSTTTEAPSTTVDTTPDTQPSTPVATNPPAPAPTWTTVIDLTGSANKRTQPFHLGSGQKRLLYNITGGDVVVCGIYVVESGHSLESEGGFPEVMLDAVGPGETALAQGEGDYYLDVTSANCNWQVTVQEMK